jgi:beta-lactamase class A
MAAGPTAVPGGSQTQPMPAWSRRAFLSMSAGALAAGAVQSPRAAQSAAPSRLDQLELELGGRVGLAAIDTASGMRLAHRGDERFAMCSTFKWLLAAAVLARQDRGGLILERRLPYRPQDLLPHSPITTERAAEGSLPIAALCEAAVETSDNTAANMLLDFLGGPAALTRYLRGIGDATTRLDRIELDLNSNAPGDPRDTTTPEAMLATMQTLLLGEALSRESRALLLSWMKNCTTGLRRLRAGLPGAWVVGDKTGTGDRGAANDLAIAWPPQRPPILIAAYLSDSRASAEALDAAHASLARFVTASLARVS